MIKFMPVYFKDYHVFSNMLGSQWDLGKRVCYNSKLCNWIYFAELMASATNIFKITDENEIIGFGGYENFSCNHRILYKKMWRVIYNLLFCFIKNKEGLENYYKTYDYAPLKVKEMFDAEVTILILDKKVRGLGLGKSLFNEICRRAKESGANNLRIDTDKSCNVNFYYKLECEKIFESKCGKDGEEYSEEVYVLYKKL